MEKEKNTKTLMILMIICVCLSITTLGIVIYDRFIRKEPEHAVLKPIDVVPNNNQEKKFTKLEKIELDDKGKNITINNKNVVVKATDDALYVNEKKVASEYYSIDSAYVTDYFIMFVSYGQGGEIYLIFDENGKEIVINNAGQYDKLRIENGNLVAEESWNFECIEDENTKCDTKTQKVQFIYDGTSVTVK